MTEFEFRLHPIDGRALIAGLVFDPADARNALRAWRDLLPDAPRAATLTADASTVDDQPIVSLGFVWVGDPEEGRTFLRTLRELGTPVTERVHEMTYVGLQCMSDDPNVHGRRRYSKGHYLTELSDAAIDAFLQRGMTVNGTDPDWSQVPGGGFTAFGGAIADVGDDDAAFSHRDRSRRVCTSTRWTMKARTACAGRIPPQSWPGWRS